MIAMAMRGFGDVASANEAKSFRPEDFPFTFFILSSSYCATIPRRFSDGYFLCDILESFAGVTDVCPPPGDPKCQSM
jgi:hypothetical protein